MNIGKLATFLRSLGAKIHNSLVAIFGQSAIDNLEAQIKTILSDDARTIFIDAINAAQSLMVGGVAATGTQKRDAAFTQISADLKAKGIGLATNAVNLGIELVVGLLKAKAPAS